MIYYIYMILYICIYTYSITYEFIYIIYIYTLYMIIDSINMECICINYCIACSIPNSWAVLQQPLELRRREQAPFSGNPLGVRHPSRWRWFTDGFSRMRSKGSRFTLGVWGLRGGVRSTLRSRAQPFATVRNRSREDRMAAPMGSFTEVVLFGGFRRLAASFRVAGVALRDIQTCSATCRKSFLRGRRNTFATFSEDVLQFSWQAQHFGRVHRHFSWQAQHFRRVLWRVFCKSHWQGCVKWWQGANSVAGVAFSDMCWKLTEASHETSILRLQIFRF